MIIAYIRVQQFIKVKMSRMACRKNIGWSPNQVKYYLLYLDMKHEVLNLKHRTVIPQNKTYLSTDYNTYNT